MPTHVTAPHDKLCLLRNTRLSLAATVLFAAVGVFRLLTLANVLPAVRPDTLLPLEIVGSLIIFVISLRFFTCLAERAILVLVIVSTLFKLVSLMEPQLFTGILRWERITEVVILFSCAAISGFAALRSLRTTGPESGRLQE